MKFLKVSPDYLDRAHAWATANPGVALFAAFALLLFFTLDRDTRRALFTFWR